MGNALVGGPRSIGVAAGMPSVPAADRARIAMARMSRRLPGFRGKGRLLRLLDSALRHCGASSRPLNLVVDGTRYDLITEDLIDFRTAYFGGHDTRVVDFLDARIRPTRTVLWDVGANVGSIFLPLARRHPELWVEAFEPAPPVIARLRRNLALNPDLAPRVRVHDLALHNRDTVVDFYVSGTDTNSGLGSLAASEAARSRPVPVAARTGDRLVETGVAVAPDLIKLDLEGFEYEALDGLRRVLAATRHVVVVFEHEPYRLAERGVGARAIDLLHGHGFSVYTVPAGGAPRPWSARMLQQRQNLVALRD